MSFSGGVPFISRAEKQSAATRRLQQKSAQGSISKLGLRPSTSEYADKYIKWDLTADGYRQVQAASPRRSYNPIPSNNIYELAMNVANWNTESRDQYTEKQPAPTEHYATSAGADGGSHDSVAEVLTEGDDKPNARKAVVWPQTEYDANYKASPVPLQAPKLVTRPAGHAPYVLDDADGVGGWASEYQRRCAELRQKQQDLLSLTLDAAAGMPSGTGAVLPMYYAWEAPDVPAPVRTPAVSRPNSATSEYRAQYTEKDVSPPSASRVLNNSTLILGSDDSFNANRQSLYDASYTGAAGEPVVRQAPQSERQPMQFAWSLENPATPQEVAPKESTRRAAVMSEYDEMFDAKAFEPRSAMVAPQDELVVGGLGGAGSEESKNMQSEYDDMYKAGAFSPALRISRGAVSEAPPQFAWSLLDPPRSQAPESGGEDDARLHFPADMASEYRDEYAGDYASAPREMSADRSLSMAQLLSLDEASSSKGWHSVYEDMCSDLRSKQQALRAQATAGIRTTRKEAAPAYYVWEKPLPAPAPAPASRPLPDGPAPTSEYNDKFVETVAPRTSPARDRSSLDLFEGEGGVLASEYDDRFTFRGDEESKGESKTAGTMTARYGDERPMNFAWAEKTAKPVSTSNVDAGPGLRDAESVYASNYAWPSAQGRGSINPANLPYGNPNPIVSAEARAQDTEYMQTSASEESKSGADSPVAGKPTSADPKHPFYYAWPSSRPVAAEQPTRAPRSNGPVHVSEYADQFVAAVGDRCDRMDRSSLQLFEGSGEDVEVRFSKSTNVRNAAAAPVAGLQGVRDPSRPSMFAWADVSEVAAAASSKHMGKGDLRTENSVNYLWPPSDAGVRKAAPPASHLVHSVTVMGTNDEEAIHQDTARWQSEYDGRNAAEQRAVKTFPASSGHAARPRHGPESPLNFAWRTYKSERNESPQRSRSAEDSSGGESEYAANYTQRRVEPQRQVRIDGSTSKPTVSELLSFEDKAGNPSSSSSSSSSTSSNSRASTPHYRETTRTLRETCFDTSAAPKRAASTPRSFRTTLSGPEATTTGNSFHSTAVAAVSGLGSTAGSGMSEDSLAPQPKGAASVTIATSPSSSASVASVRSGSAQSSAGMTGGRSSAPADSLYPCVPTARTTTIHSRSDASTSASVSENGSVSVVDDYIRRFPGAAPSNASTASSDCGGGGGGGGGGFGRSSSAPSTRSQRRSVFADADAGGGVPAAGLPTRAAALFDASYDGFAASAAPLRSFQRAASPPRRNDYKGGNKGGVENVLLLNKRFPGFAPKDVLASRWTTESRSSFKNQRNKR